jgi:glycosyltransferase involved in cell wall biosynthesis
MHSKVDENGISIIVPSIGRETLEKLLVSIHLDKTLNKHEIVIVSNAKISADLKIKYSKYKCINFVEQNHENISKSRNMGIQLSSFSIISMIDDDDLWVNGRANFFYNALRGGSRTVVFGSSNFYSGKLNKKIKRGKEQVIDFASFIQQFNPKIFSKQKYFLQVGNCAFKRNEKIPEFNEELSYLEDQIWILELLQNDFIVTQIAESTLDYFFSRERSNNRWNIGTEKAIYRYILNIDSVIARKYIYKRSLKSLAISPNRRAYINAKIEIKKTFKVDNRGKISILLLSCLNNIIFTLSKLHIQSLNFLYSIKSR